MNPYHSIHGHLRPLTDEVTRDGSEFGGVASGVQPPPHEPTASETLHALYATDPNDELSYVDTDKAAPPIHFRED